MEKGRSGVKVQSPMEFPRSLYWVPGRVERSPSSVGCPDRVSEGLEGGSGERNSSCSPVHCRRGPSRSVPDHGGWRREEGRVCVKASALRSVRKKEEFRHFSPWCPVRPRGPEVNREGDGEPLGV